jgi:hypothetical protein
MPSEEHLCTFVFQLLLIFSGNILILILQFILQILIIYIHFLFKELIKVTSPPPETNEQRNIHQINFHNNRDTYSHMTLDSLAGKTVTTNSSHYETHNKFAPQFFEAYI